MASSSPAASKKACASTPAGVAGQGACSSDTTFTAPVSEGSGGSRSVRSIQSRDAEIRG